MKSNQSGFSVIEIIMAVVIVGLVGAVGWLYWSNASNKQGDTKVTATNKEVAKAASSPSSVETYKLKTQPLAFDYPSSWRVKSSIYTGKGDVESENLTVSSVDGFTLLLGTFGDGLGGTGPCERNITDFKLEGSVDPSLKSDKGVVSYMADGDFILNIAGKTLEEAKSDCLGYDELISLRKIITGDENGLLDDGKASQFVFGTNVLFQDTVSKNKPGDKVYKEAVAILKSLRKI